jgi:hypothetical protein
MLVSPRQVFRNTAVTGCVRIIEIRIIEIGIS